MLKINVTRDTRYFRKIYCASALINFDFSSNTTNPITKAANNQCQYMYADVN